jgi:hypothetical protein
MPLEFPLARGLERVVDVIFDFLMPIFPLVFGGEESVFEVAGGFYVLKEFLEKGNDLHVEESFASKMSDEGHVVGKDFVDVGEFFSIEGDRIVGVVGADSMGRFLYEFGSIRGKAEKGEVDLPLDRGRGEIDGFGVGVISHG